MKSYGVTIHMKATTSLLLNKCSPLPSLRFNVRMLANNRTCNYAHKHLVLYNIGSGRRGVKKRLKVVAFPTLLTISSDFSTLRNVLFQTQGNLSLHFDLGPLES